MPKAHSQLPLGILRSARHAKSVRLIAIAKSAWSSRAAGRQANRANAVFASTASAVSTLVRTSTSKRLPNLITVVDGGTSADAERKPGGVFALVVQVDQKVPILNRISSQAASERNFTGSNELYDRAAFVRKVMYELRYLQNKAGGLPQGDRRQSRQAGQDGRRYLAQPRSGSPRAPRLPQRRYQGARGHRRRIAEMPFSQ